MEKDINGNLEERHLREETFHDEKAMEESKDSFYEHGAAWYAYEKMLKMAGDLQNKQVLDLGCGTGWASIVYAEKGAEVTGLDISDDSLRIARQNVRQKGLEDKIRFKKGVAEDLPFNRQFDLIIGIGILHHTDLELVSTSISKALKSGGKALFLEPLDHNPIIKVFRILTPRRRSRDEKPLEVTNIEDFKKDFGHVSYRGYNLLSLLAFMFVPIKAYRIFRDCVKTLNRLDDFLFGMIPSIQRYCWGAIIELRK